MAAHKWNRGWHKACNGANAMGVRLDPADNMKFEAGIADEVYSIARLRGSNCCS
jgi:hypothetical protein